MAKTDDLVEMSGVSRSTVFRFLRGESVRPSARDAIIHAMQSLNMPFEKRVARQDRFLQIFVKRGYRAFKGYGLAISGFMEKAEANGFEVNLRTGGITGKNFASRLTESGAATPSGVLLLGMTMEEEDEEIRIFQKLGIPFVFVNRMFDDPQVSWVSCDLRAAARDAVDHLLDLGHTKIGTWGVTASSRIDVLKREGFVSAFTSRGLPVPVSALDMHKHGDLEPAIQKLIDSGSFPKAWFFGSDEHVLRFMSLARANGIRVPEDAVVVGMDSVEGSEFDSAGITSVRMPFHEEGEAAFDILMRLMENPHEASVRVVLRHSLVIRESSGSKVKP